MLSDYEKCQLGRNSSKSKASSDDGIERVEIGTCVAVNSEQRRIGQEAEIGVVTKACNGYYHVRFADGQQCFRRHQLSTDVQPERKRARSTEPHPPLNYGNLSGMVARTIFLKDGRSGLCESSQGSRVTLKLYTSSLRVAHINVHMDEIDMERTQAHADTTNWSAHDEQEHDVDADETCLLSKGKAAEKDYSACMSMAHGPTHSSVSLADLTVASRALQRLTPEARQLLLATVHSLRTKNGRLDNGRRRSCEISTLDLDELRALSASQHLDNCSRPTCRPSAKCGKGSTAAATRSVDAKTKDATP